MTKRRIKRIKHIDTTLEVAGAKIYGMHMLAISSLARGKANIHNILVNDHFLTFLNALEKLGIESDYTYSTRKKTRDISIIGTAGNIAPYIGELHIQNSTTSLYFLMSMLNLGSGIYCISTGEKLNEKSVVDIKNILETMGANITLREDKYPPILLEAQGCNAGKLHFAERINHQIIASLLVAAPYARKPLEIYFDNDTKISSYINVTIDCMKKFGVEVETDGDKYLRVNNDKQYEAPEHIQIEADVIIAIYFFSIVAIVGGRLQIDNINYYQTKQEYVKFVDILEQMGCSIVRGDNFIEVARDVNKELNAVNVDMSNMKMLTQLLAVITLKCNGESVLSNCRSLDDGMDRLKIISSEFKSIGANVEIINDNSIKIIPSKHYSPATIDAYNDYRTAMAFSLIGTFVDGIFILDEHSVTKAYNDFFEVLDQLAK